jgi:hypothetical protein
VRVKAEVRVFVFWTMHFLKVKEKPTNALIVQCIGIFLTPFLLGMVQNKGMFYCHCFSLLL